MMAVLLALLLAGPQESPEKNVDALIVRLRDGDLEAREAASRDLVALGDPAIVAIEKAAAAESDPETLTRLKAAVDRIRRNVQAAKVAPPLKPVTVSASGVLLRDLLKDLCGQAGVEYVCEGGIGDRKITVEAEKEPLLRVIDRICARDGGISPEVVDGKLKLTSTKWMPEPSAYTDGYRIRIRKTVLTETVEGDSVKTSVALYFELDAQPDHKFKGNSVTLPSAAILPGGDAVTVKGLGDMSARVGGWIAAGVGAPIIDGVAVGVEAAEALDRICLIKDLPAGVERLESLKIGARYRYSVGLKTVTIPLSSKNFDKLPDIPYHVNFSGAQLVFQPSENCRAPLEDYVDLEQMVLIGKDGKEAKLTPLAGGMRARQYYYQSERLFQGETPQLRLQIMDAFDRDVEFEFKNIPLRKAREVDN
jgi:hypothetical protein